MRPVLRLGSSLVVACASVALGCQQVQPEPEPTPHTRATALAQEEPPPLGSTPTQPVEVRPATSSSDVKPVVSAEAPDKAEPRPAVVPELRRLVVSTAVKDKEPVPMSALKVNDPVVAFLELGNASPAAAVVQVVFQHETGHEVGFVKLTVPAEKSRWRTWAQTARVNLAGKWTAIVRAEDGAELGQQGFFVSPT